MVAAGEWPDPALLEAVLAQGEKAIGPLVEVVRREVHGWPAEAPLHHALGLLSMLPPAQEALAPVLALFHRLEGEGLEDLPPILQAFGPQVIEPCLAVVRDPTLDWYTRSVASNVALEVSRGDPERRNLVLATLRELLAGYVERAARKEKFGENDYMTASSLIVDLAHVADPEARPQIDAAVEAELSEMMSAKDVEACYREGERLPRQEQEWLKLYREHLQRHLDYERRKAEPPLPPPRIPPRPPSRPSPPPPLFKPAPPAPKRQIGRNDPCWCGSGKKFKNCHMRIDEG
jgi:hypothetical protein